MEKVAVRLDGRECGELTAEEQGLYVRYRAVCRLAADTAPARLIAVGERGELRLGILQPEGGLFVLRRQLSAREAYPAGPLLRGELRLCLQEGGWRKWGKEDLTFRDAELRKAMEESGEGLICRSGKGRFLAFPFDTGSPFPVAKMFCFARIRKIGGKEYAVFCLDEEERPILP